MGGVVYGIDFGTSTSAVVVVRADGVAVRIKDPGSPHGLSSVPSAVCAQRDGSLAVGAAAERTKRTRPAAYRSGFKRDFADAAPVLLGGRSLLPFELAAEVLAFLRGQAMAAVPDDAEHVVITVPAAWEGTSRELMMRAATLAGFDAGRVSLITEPVAAAAYATSGARPAGDRTLLIYDLGGGTFDCALARQSAAGTFEVLGRPGGIEDIGGAAFDNRILRHIAGLHPQACAGLLDGAATDTATWRRRLQLRDTCEQIKIQLSITESYEELITEFDEPVEFELTRREFDRLIGPLIEETVNECERMLAGQGLDWAAVDTVVPVGGSSRLPLVARVLGGRSGRPVHRVDDPELAIALGAALLAGRRARPGGPTPVIAQVIPVNDGHHRPAGRPAADRDDTTTGHGILWPVTVGPSAPVERIVVPPPVTGLIEWSIPAPQSGLVDAVRKVLLDVKPSRRLQIAPRIPHEKLHNAAGAHRVRPGEDILALYDLTIWSGGEESLLLTSLGLRFRNSDLVEGSEVMVGYDRFAAGGVELLNSRHAVFGDGMQRSISVFDEADLAPMRALFAEIGRLAAPSRQYPPDQVTAADRFIESVGRTSEQRIAELATGPERSAALGYVFGWLAARCRTDRLRADAVLHWVIGGSRPETFELVITRGTCVRSPVPVQAPTASVKLDAVTLLNLVSGRVGLSLLERSGDLKLAGDVRVVANLAGLFDLPAP